MKKLTYLCPKCRAGTIIEATKGDKPSDTLTCGCGATAYRWDATAEPGEPYSWGSIREKLDAQAGTTT